jgi:hypothetical protein
MSVLSLILPDQVSSVAPSGTRSWLLNRCALQKVLLFVYKISSSNFIYNPSFIGASNAGRAESSYQLRRLLTTTYIPEGKARALKDMCEVERRSDADPRRSFA